MPEELAVVEQRDADLAHDIRDRRTGTPDRSGRPAGMRAPGCAQCARGCPGRGQRSGSGSGSCAGRRAGARSHPRRRPRGSGSRTCPRARPSRCRARPASGPSRARRRPTDSTAASWRAWRRSRWFARRSRSDDRSRLATTCRLPIATTTAAMARDSMPLACVRIEVRQAKRQEHHRQPGDSDRRSQRARPVMRRARRRGSRARAGATFRWGQPALATPTNASDMPSRDGAHPRRRKSPRRQEGLQPDERDRNGDASHGRAELRRTFDGEDGQGERDREEELRVALEAAGQPCRAKRALSGGGVGVLEEERDRRVRIARSRLRGARGFVALGLGGRGGRAGRGVGSGADARRGGIHGRLGWSAGVWLGTIPRRYPGGAGPRSPAGQSVVQEPGPKISPCSLSNRDS